MQEEHDVQETHETHHRAHERDYTLPGSILIAALLISGSIIYLVGAQNRGGGAPSPQGGDTTKVAPAKLMELSSRDVILGDPKAPVTLIEYGDYQCPFCGRFFSGPEQDIRDEYIKSGKVRMVFRNLAFLGPESIAAAQATECAKDQGKFWAYHDALFTAEINDGQEGNGNLTQTLFLKFAKDVGMDVATFTSCVDSKKYTAQITADNASAHAFGIDSTPTSFMNGEEIKGAQPFSAFKELIDAALAKK